jgi:hypothetical protein
VTRALLEEFSELTDVIVHIDAEDDELLETRDAASIPPLRREIRTALTEAWSDEVTPEEIRKMILHYLNHRVDVELHLNKDRFTDSATAGQLQNRLEMLATHLPWVNHVTVWYG